MDHTPTLETVIAQYAQEASVLRQHGHTEQAATIELIITRVTESAEPYLTWISEANAQLRSGHSAAWLRSKFGEWAREGNARMRGTKREYRKLVVPQRLHAEALSA